jgi:hypothetical protein
VETEGAQQAEQHGKALAELEQIIEAQRLDLEAAEATLADHASSTVVQELLAENARLTELVAAQDELMAGVTEEIKVKDAELAAFHALESQLHETEIELSLQTGLVEKLEEEVLTRKAWKDDKASKKAAEAASKKGVWKGGGRHNHAAPNSFGAAEKHVRTKGNAARHSVGRRESFTFSGPPRAHDTQKSNEMLQEVAVEKFSDNINSSY